MEPNPANVAAIDQNLAAIADELPAALRRYHDGLIAQGFNPLFAAQATMEMGPMLASVMSWQQVALEAVRRQSGF